MTEVEAVRMMGWEGAFLFGRWMPPMREFLPNAYARWYDKLVNELLPAAGDEAMVAFIEAEFRPIALFQRHATREAPIDLEALTPEDRRFLLMHDPDLSAIGLIRRMQRGRRGRP